MDEPLRQWIARLLADRKLRGQGHAQRQEDLNLGLGWIYYGLARLLRPRKAVVIGSLRGFVPLVIGRALAENTAGEDAAGEDTEPVEIWFIDPSLVDDFWADPEQTRAHFASFGLSNVRHFRLTTQQFVETPEYRNLADVGLLFVDGYHSHEQARFDHEAFAGKLSADAFILFHDSTQLISSGIYGPGRRYTHTVKHYMDELKQDTALQVFDLPFDSGVTLVRRASS